jgi:hypothetical protein
VNANGVHGSAQARHTGDRFPLASFMGPAVVIDLRAVLAANHAKGKSAVVHADWIERWEARHGRIQPGDVPLLFSGYTDRYYKRPARGVLRLRALQGPGAAGRHRARVRVHPARSRCGGRRPAAPALATAARR